MKPAALCSNNYYILSSVENCLVNPTVVSTSTDPRTVTSTDPGNEIAPARSKLITSIKSHSTYTCEGITSI